MCFCPRDDFILLDTRRGSGIGLKISPYAVENRDSLAHHYVGGKPLEDLGVRLLDCIIILRFDLLEVGGPLCRVTSKKELTGSGFCFFEKFSYVFAGQLRGRLVVVFLAPVHDSMDRKGGLACGLLNVRVKAQLRENRTSLKCYLTVVEKPCTVIWKGS